MGKVPLDFSFVLVDEGDTWGQFLGLMTLTPFFIFISQLTLIFARRELFTFFFTLGQVLNALLAIFLKKIIRQERPLHDYPNGWKKDGYGMPSEHAMFLAYFSTFCILFFWLRLKWISHLSKIIFSFILILWAYIVCFSRLYFQVHTLSQIIVGVFFGIGFGIGWFYLIHFAIGPRLFRKIENSGFGKYFYLKDVSNINNIVAFEYDNITKAKLKKEK